ncbi:LysM peptidoglycan-binding domain-containing protein [Salirhabdus sp. Marseille-P4669]|uniref:LysM peptidoglycan-binding domain-containing protein n=1 Tax=Salirhabdus sp. Marseille-P4669 TaxID=2042310 RepID=UPI000C7B5BB6|nr:LysM peptidoglycan-binding domain-containing protein [Salirhabdus sp. Marseille-P4669]
MEPFTHYKLNETAEGIEVILYLNERLTEFANELGSPTNADQSNIKQDARSFVKQKFPKLKIKSIKIMAGAMVLTTLGLGTLPTLQASAAETTTAQSQKTTSSYTVLPGDTLYNIAKRYDTTVDTIKKANGLSSNHLQIGQALTIPNSNDIAAPTISTTYQVVAGDTLYDIAKRSGTTVDAIKQANGLTSNHLQIGQALTIPNGTEIVAPTKSSTYQVVAGDTLYDIAKRSGTTVDAIKQANGLTSNHLQIGQALTIPNGKDIVAPTQSTTYQVVAGDTLYDIAKRHGTSVDAIKQANGMSSNQLQIGQALTIPSSVTLAPSESQVTPSEQKSEVNQEDVEWLAKMIYSEGRGESLEGQIAIGAVIMNRVESPLFPNTVKDVLLEKSYGYYQFTPAATGAIYKAVPNEENIEAAKRAINGEDPTNGALFFYNPDKTSSTYLKSRTVSTVIGNHTFAF